MTGSILATGDPNVSVQYGSNSTCTSRHARHVFITCQQRRTQ